MRPAPGGRRVTGAVITSAQGALPVKGGLAFTVWAPAAERMEVRIFSPRRPALRMKKAGGGYWKASARGLGAGTRYKYAVNGRDERPDPASAFQPEGVHGPSEAVDHAAFPWADAAWRGLAPEKMIVYELHPGTFTPTGDFAGVESRIPYLKSLGVNAVELMPVSQFPGSRNWGYDGTYPYAPQNSYGGPEGLKKLVDACHRAGLAVILDVVYNHLGPEGNYLGTYGPYFTDRYRTPWGDAINYDGKDSSAVREYFIGSALGWFRDYHIDALRLDAVHGIFDFGAKHFLAELSERTRDLSRLLGRRLSLIAESDLNDVRALAPAPAGWGMAAQWSDDFHHALHTLLTGERGGYYEDFGEFGQLAKAFSDGFVYDWAWSPHRGRRHGSSSRLVHPGKFVVCSQNHDQVGNRLLGERLSVLAGERGLRLAAGAVLLSPYVPMLFMGEEYAEKNPFQYFVSHGDPDLVRAVREGRKREFAAFGWKKEPPDPQGEAAFAASRLDWDSVSRGAHAAMLDFYRRLISLRRSEPSFGCVPRRDVSVKVSGKTIALFRRRGNSASAVVFNFGRSAVRPALPPGRWRAVFDSSGRRAAEPLAPESFRAYIRGK
ncbi:MAG: maltooligosyl trehalose hydrolase [Elusimicrobia bacterium]|nr:MAG: maltooligosyl trehalose hydrolase [Elusimicrobiota bacterium]KAF0154899.1 MAG: maltooligosyl trehalose hydrolase [Elusimicrobiota bacterium]